MIKEAIHKLANKQDLSYEESETVMNEIMSGSASPVQMSSYLTALSLKGETIDEITGSASGMRANCIKLLHNMDVLEIVGTGGDGRSSFNCSTAACLTLAGMGYRIAKHGNRAASSTSGAADVLQLLGVPREKDPEKIIDNIKRTNFGFFFAPNFHPAFKYVGEARRELGIRTLFNILGPMINPAKPPYLLMGVARPEIVRLVADTLCQSPTLKRAAVVFGAGGYDEVSPMGPATIVLIENGRQSPLALDPADFGIKPCTEEDLAVHSREEALNVLQEIVQGRGSQHMKDMVALNVALAIRLVEPERSLAQCMALAREGVEGGAGANVLESLQMEQE